MRSSQSHSRFRIFGISPSSSTCNFYTHQKSSVPLRGYIHRSFNLGIILLSRRSFHIRRPGVLRAPGLRRRQGAGASRWLRGNPRRRRPGDLVLKSVGNALGTSIYCVFFCFYFLGFFSLHNLSRVWIGLRFAGSMRVFRRASRNLSISTFAMIL